MLFWKVYSFPIVNYWIVGSLCQVRLVNSFFVVYYCILDQRLIDKVILLQIADIGQCNLLDLCLSSISHAFVSALRDRSCLGQITSLFLILNLNLLRILFSRDKLADQLKLFDLFSRIGVVDSQVRCEILHQWRAVGLLIVIEFVDRSVHVRHFGVAKHDTYISLQVVSSCWLHWSMSVFAAVKSPLHFFFDCLKTTFFRLGIPSWNERSLPGLIKAVKLFSEESFDHELVLVLLFASTSLAHLTHHSKFVIQANNLLVCHMHGAWFDRWL